jgi:hypothetical protein
MWMEDSKQHRNKKQKAISKNKNKQTTDIGQQMTILIQKKEPTCLIAITKLFFFVPTEGDKNTCGENLCDEK